MNIMDETQSDSTIAAYTLYEASTRKYIHTCRCPTCQVWVCASCTMTVCMPICSTSATWVVAAVTLWNGHPKFLTSSEFYLRLPLVLNHSCLRTCLALRCKTTILETWPKISPPSSHNVSSFFLGHRKSHSESRLLMETGYWTGLLWQRFTVWIMITFKIILCYKIWLVSFCCPYYSL